MRSSCLMAAALAASIAAAPQVRAAAPAAQPADAVIDTASNAEMDRRANEVFDLLKAGKTPEAFDVSLGRSPLMAGKDAERLSLVAQIETTLRLYGPITGIEKVRQTNYGTMFVKRFYVVQHEKMLTRWEFNFSRLKSGWAVTFIGFEDQSRTWE